jgi:uncharacterized membrane protein YsdA (DUF1294 family)
MPKEIAMDVLLAATNIYFNAMCAFFAVMGIVGFCLIRTDKKRWNAQKARSDEMMQRKPKAKPAEDGAQEGAEEGKKKRAKSEEPFEYQARISDKAIFTIAILFGAFGELLGMIIYRHKWYKFNYRVYIPILSLFNLIFAAVILYLLYTKGDSSVYVNF